MGDFNKILSASYKFGEARPNQGRIEEFREFLDERKLLDLGFVGPKFTWNNCRDN